MPSVEESGFMTIDVSMFTLVCVTFLVDWHVFRLGRTIFGRWCRMQFLEIIDGIYTVCPVCTQAETRYMSLCVCTLCVPPQSGRFSDQLVTAKHLQTDIKLVYFTLATFGKGHHLSPIADTEPTILTRLFVYVRLALERMHLSRRRQRWILP